MTNFNYAPFEKKIEKISGEDDLGLQMAVAFLATFNQVFAKKPYTGKSHKFRGTSLNLDGCKEKGLCRMNVK